MTSLSAEMRVLVADVESAVRNPQALASGLSALIVALGTIGILNAGLTTALQAALTAVLALATAIGHVTASTKIAARAAERAAVQAQAAPPIVLSPPPPAAGPATPTQQ